MASTITHAIVAGCAYYAIRRPSYGLSILILGVMCSVIPDLDVIGFRYGIEYGDMLGHRGATHSILFAVMWSLLITVVFHRRRTSREKISLWGFYFFCTMSHGILDAMTTGGMGIGFLIPFSDERYFFPYRFIKVSSLRWQSFFSSRGLRVLQNEAVYVILPALLTSLSIILIRKIAKKR